jgi:MPBQ/MSBQ methyltransferase
LPVEVPPYFDLLIDGFKSGRTGRHVHLGYWDKPPPLTTPCGPEEFEAAQARLNDIVIELADLNDGRRVLDVGCGFGGSLAAINARWRDMQLVGLNIDRRQVDICRTIVPRQSNSLAFAVADASALPFKSACFDRVVCLEAIFHFASREAFLQQASAALRAGGRLVLTDILMKRPGSPAPVDVALIERTMRREYGPWPGLWVDSGEIVAAARSASLVLEQTIDVTAQTLPTYRMTAPHDEEPGAARLSAGGLMRWLHREGHLSYLCFVFSKA